MTDENKPDEQHNEQPKPGFEIRLPYGLGWLRGGEAQLNLILPTIRLVAGISIVCYMIVRLLQAIEQMNLPRH